MNFVKKKNIDVKQQNSTKEKTEDILNPSIYHKYSYDLEKNVNSIVFSGKNVVFVGISGGQASGKSKIVSYLHQHVKRSNTLSEINFFIQGEKNREFVKEDEYLFKENDIYDLKRRLYLIDINNPNSYDYEKFYQTLKDLSEGKKISVPNFDEEKCEFIGEKVIDPTQTPLIIIDGYFILKEQKIRDMLNLKIYQEVEDDVRLSKLVLREEKYLGENPEAFELFFDIYKKFFKKTFDENIAPFKKMANVLLPDYSIDENNILEDDEILRLIVTNLNHLFKLQKKK